MRDPAGHLVRQVAIGFTSRDRGSLDADGTGRRLLCLSGRDLFLSRGGGAPFLLTSRLVAAAWLRLPAGEREVAGERAQRGPAVGTEGMSAEDLAALVTLNGLIGTALV